MNIKQKRAIMIAILLIGITIIIWLLVGGEFFTKTQILVEKELTEIDKMLGLPPQKEYQDGFVFGLVPPGFAIGAEMISVATISGLFVLITGILFFKYKSKK